MDTDLALSIRRAPTVDALYGLHASAWDSWVVADNSGRIEGMGSVLVRDGYIDGGIGAVGKIGYLGDLRFSTNAEGRLLLDRAFGPILAEARARYGCEYYLTGVIASNERARRALTVQTERRRDEVGRAIRCCASSTYARCTWYSRAGMNDHRSPFGLATMGRHSVDRGAARY